MEFGVGEVNALILSAVTSWTDSAPRDAEICHGLTADSISDAAENLLSELRAAQDGRQVDIESAILRGKPANTLLDYAAEVDADIIVAGQRGAGAITGALLGSTTDRLTRTTDRPLVVVPASDTTG